MSTPPPTDKPQSSRGVSCLRALARLLLVIILGALLGLAIYAGMVYLYQQAIVPAQESAARLDLLETRQVISQQEMDDRLKQIMARLNTLESQRSLDTESLAQLEGDVSSLQARLEAQNSTLKQLNELQADVANLEKLATYDSTQVMGLYATLNAPDTPLEELSRQVQVLKAMQLLNRSRLLMVQNNWGLAETDVDNARQILLALQAEAPDYQQETLRRWIQRLDLVLAGLPETPVLAADDLEIAWRMLAAGLPARGENLTPQPTAYLTGTGEPSATPTASGTLSTSVSPSPSPTVTPILGLTATAIATPTP